MQHFMAGFAKQAAKKEKSESGVNYEVLPGSLAAS